MTADHTLTVASLTLLATVATALTFAFVTATPAPRHVVQSPTLADAYTEAWNSLKEAP